tara:strand:+ start:190 stop:879 length:690 start_codon:yes stop_codon:yes gene_type:complete
MVGIGSLAAAGIGSAAKGVAGGLATAIGGTAEFDRNDRKRLEDLERLRRSGQLGLSTVEQQRIESQQAVSRGGMLRGQQQQQAAANQALANQQALSGREIFLGAMAGQEAEAQLRGQQAQAMAQQDMQARQLQMQQIQNLQEARRARKAAVRSGLTQALTAGVLGAAGAVGGEAYDQKVASAEALKLRTDKGNLAIAEAAKESRAATERFNRQRLQSIQGFGTVYGGVQ